MRASFRFMFHACFIELIDPSPVLGLCPGPGPGMLPPTALSRQGQPEHRGTTNEEQLER